jgi:uncharacterized membrane protein YgcG
MERLGAAKARAMTPAPVQGAHQAMQQVFAAQNPRGQAAVVRGVLSGKADPVTVRAVRDAVAKMGNRATLMDPYLPAKYSGPSLGVAFSNALGKLQSLHLEKIGEAALNPSGTGFRLGQNLAGSLKGSKPAANPFGKVQEAGMVPTKLASMFAREPVDVTRAFAQSPSAIPKTITGLGNAAVGSVAALAQLPVRVVQEGPGKAFSDLYHGMVNDYGSRYGPLYNGNDQAFINRIAQQGAGPEALDAFGVVGGLDATAGRAAVDVTRAGEGLAGRAPGFLTRERPGLRTAGGEVRPQNLAKTALRVTAQRAEDKLRAVKEARAPGEIPARANEVRPLFGNRSQRVLTSFVASKYRRMMQDKLNTEVRNGANRSLARMSSWERRATPVVLEGIVPLDRGIQAAKDALQARIASIVKDRAEHPQSPGNHIPPEWAAQVDELPTLQALHDNVGKWLTPRLTKFVKQEGARNVRLEGAMPDSYLRQPVAEARRLRPQGEALGIEHPDTINARGGEHQATFADALHQARHGSGPETYDHARPGLLADYSSRVRAAAQAHGLPEPSYVPHRDVPQEKLGNYTQGSGQRAMPGPKQSQFALFKGGSVWRDPRAYTSGLARSIKVGHQWPMVDEMLRRASLPEPSAAAIEAAGLGKRAADKLTGREYLRAMQFDGHKAENVRLYNPGRLRESTLEERGLKPGASEAATPRVPSAESRAGSAPPELEANQMLRDLMETHSAPGKTLGALGKDEQFLKTTGWKALPNTAYKEIHSSLSPSGLGGRLVGKLQGTAGHLILGGSPSFLVMNTLAHMVLAAFGTRGRILSDAAKFPLWWHGLTDEERAVVDSHAGGRAQGGSDRLGSTAPNKLAAGWEKLKQQGIGRFNVGSVASMANPFHVLFRAEDMQSNFFRRMVYYNATKRAALDSMAKDMSLGQSAANRFSHVFTVGPKKQMLAQIANMHTAEELGRHTVNMMGDYARFTSFERKFINNRAVLFYSFMRHAARTLFYVLPLHHPIATALVGEMAKLHNDEVKKLLGGDDLPYAYSRLYFDKNGHLTSIDFARSSPVGSIGTSLPQEGIAGAAQAIPPEVQPLLNAIYRTTPTGAKYKNNVFSLLNSFAAMSYPYRLTQELHDGTQLQQSDSVPFVHEDPLTHKSVAGQAYQAAKQAASGPASQKVLASALGLYPRPDDIQVIAQHQMALKASKAAGGSSSSSGGWGGGSSTSGGWGGSSSSSGGWG